MKVRERAARRRTVELKGALTLVTGAGNGIGRAIALALDHQGAQVLAVDIDEDAAGKTAAECREGEAFGCDVADPGAVQALADEVHSTWRPLDLLVNNAGVGISGRFDDMSGDDWRWIRGVNLDGVVNGCQAFGTQMVKRGSGHVVNIASAASFSPVKDGAAYATTKAGVRMLSQCLRAEWRPRGVSVTAICPGMVRSSMAQRMRFVSLTDEEIAKVTAFMERWSRLARDPALVAGAVLDAIERDPPMVASGWDGKLLWALHRLLPQAAQPFTRRKR